MAVDRMVKDEDDISFEEAITTNSKNKQEPISSSLRSNTPSIQAKVTKKDKEVEKKGKEVEKIMDHMLQGEHHTRTYRTHS
jgi:hypothetical protein